MQSRSTAVRVLLAGGGTGGHVMPALAVAERLQQRHPDAALLFVGSRGLERRIVPAAGFELELIDVGRLAGGASAARLRTLAGLGPAIVRAARIVSRFDPSIVVGVGGYASAPTVIAASLMRRPVVLLEQNAVLGLTNRLLSRLARRVVVAFESAARELPQGRAALLGNPLRPALVEALSRPRPDRGDSPSLLVLGGSQGAHRLNELVVDALPRLDTSFGALRVVHQTGEADQRWVAGRYRSTAIEATVVPFIEDMAKAYRAADLVVARAGATTLAELSVAGLPALLVPYPFAAADHQAKNAQALVAAGGALMEQQANLTGGRLAKVLSDLLADRVRLAQMACAMRGCGRPDAAERVVDLIGELTSS